MELRGEVHLERAGELGRSAEGEVDILAKNLGDVGARDLHALGEVGLRNAQLLHAQENLAQECRADVVDCSHRGQGSGVSSQESGVCTQNPQSISAHSALKTSSRRVEYAAEYFTFWRCAELS